MFKGLRDHVVHALLTYILGIYINEKMMPKFGERVDPFRWKISCLFHDISYPIELAHRIIKKYLDNTNDILRSIGSTHSELIYKFTPNDMIRLQKIDEFGKPYNSFKLINKIFKKWELDIDPEKQYKDIFAKGKICHGILSSLTLFFLIDQLYQKNNHDRINPDRTNIENDQWNEKYFDEDIIPACSAIYLHNLDKSIFKNNKINPKIAPEAFLLRLCDSLQEWSRPSSDMPEGYPPYLFDISIDENGRLNFVAELPDVIKTEIETTIHSTLDIKDYFSIR